MTYQNATSTGPELVDLSRFSPDENLGRADEVNLAVQVDEARITDLTPYGGTGVAFLLSGARDEQSLTSIRGAIIAPSRDHAQIYLETRVLGTGVFGTLYHVNGSGLDAHPQAATLENAMDDLGLVRTAEFTFVEPYYAGRDAAFAPKLNWPLYAALACLALGLFLVAYGFRARTVRRRMREAAAAQMALHFDRLGDKNLAT